MTPIPILFTAPHEKAKAKALMEHCLNLDGTKLHQITLKEEPKGLVYPGISNFSFLHCCDVMAGDPFVWLECDSIPLRPGWLKKLSERWEQGGRKTLLPKDKHSPYDLCTGIGIWTKDVYRKIPAGIVSEGFDGYTFKNLKYDTTELIQHIYGSYKHDGSKCIPLEFPKDLWLIRESAQIFHADKDQQLIRLIAKGKL